MDKEESISWLDAIKGLAGSAADIIKANRTPVTQTTPTNTLAQPFDWKPIAYIGGGLVVVGLLVMLVRGK